MSDDIRQYLAQEVADAEKSFKLGLIAMAVLTVIIIGYFQWLKSQTAEILEPRNLSTLMISEVKRNMPVAREALTDNLTQATPDIVKFITESVVDEALPMVRDIVEALFRDYSRELAGYGTLAMSQAFEEIVASHEEALKAAAGKGEPGRYEPDAIAQELSAAIDVQLAKKLNDRPEESVALKLKESVTALQNINRHLKSMASSKKLGKRDELGKKLITTWWSFLNRHESSATATDKMLDTIKKPITSGDIPEVPGDE